jgi:hypothetical protein
MRMVCHVSIILTVVLSDPIAWLLRIVKIKQELFLDSLGAFLPTVRARRT